MLFFCPLFVLLFSPTLKGVPVTPPTDLKAGHWARANTLRMIEMEIVPAHAKGKTFDGEKPATRTELINALAKWAQILETGKWKTSRSAPVTPAIEKTLNAKSWGDKPVTRFVLAETLARTGDYFALALKPVPSEDKTRGKSRAITAPLKIRLTKSHPAYVSLTYLASNRMVSSGSPLLNPNGASLSSAGFSAALAEVATGLMNAMTPLGHDKDGSTIDQNSFKKRP